MNKRMTSAARAQLADAIRARYIAASPKEKRKILEEFIAATGYHEKSAIRILNSAPVSRRGQSRHRASLYDEAVRAALIVLWEASDRVCSKRLKALLPILLPALERNGHREAKVRPGHRLPNCRKCSIASSGTKNSHIALATRRNMV